MDPGRAQFRDDMTHGHLYPVTIILLNGFKMATFSIILFLSTLYGSVVSSREYGFELLGFSNTNPHYIISFSISTRISCRLGSSLEAKVSFFKFLSSKVKFYM